MRTITLNTGLLLSLLAGLACAQDNGLPRTPSPPGANAYIISPADGEHVTSPVTIRFGLQGMGIAPAGVQAPNTGHHHLLIDVDQMPSMSMPLPANEHVVHFGGGQTETQIALTPGRHTLQLVLGDHLHIPHNPPVESARITITVTAD